MRFDIIHEFLRIAAFLDVGSVGRRKLRQIDLAVNDIFHIERERLIYVLAQCRNCVDSRRFERKIVPMITLRQSELVDDRSLEFNVTWFRTLPLELWRDIVVVGLKFHHHQFG